MAYANRNYHAQQHYDPLTKQLVDHYPNNMSAQQYYRSTQIYTNSYRQPETLEDALFIIQKLREKNRRLQAKVRKLQQANGIK
jgi:hypothetical protein